MQLIIAEKPSLARNIAGALGAKTRRNGYIEGDGFLVTWAFGHLFSLYDIEDYTGGAGQRWKLQGLPFFPSAFRFKLRQDANKQTDDGVRKQFEVIRSLCAREDVDGIVNAGDADREGEIIVRLCVQNACKRDVPCRRLWLPDQTAETIKAAVQEMQDASAYDRLADEAAEIRTGNTYTFRATNKTAAERFLITATPPRTPTQVETVGAEPRSEKAEKIIHENKLMILYHGAVYDAQGARVRIGKEGAK